MFFWKVIHIQNPLLFVPVQRDHFFQMEFLKPHLKKRVLLSRDASRVGFNLDYFSKNVLKTLYNKKPTVFWSKLDDPKTEKAENWSNLFQIVFWISWAYQKAQKTKQKLYSKVPQFKKKTDYEYEMRNKMNSDRPSMPLTIVKLRVIKQSEIQDTQAE